MSLYQTNNPVPSNDPRDLDDNAKIFDQLLNDTVPSVPDRLLVPRKTWWQVEQDAAALVSPNVSALSGLILAVNKGIYATGVGALATYDLTAQARTFAAATTVADQRTVLGLGPVATESTVPVSKGGTGGTSQATARTGLGAAASGANSDITSLTGLTTPLSVAQGGSGGTSQPFTRANSVGTVSQTAGVPTGAAFETGGTLAGTGKYFKYADGHMKIIKTLAVGTGSTTAKGSIFGSAAVSGGSFPVAFVGDVPVVQHSGTDLVGGGWTALEVFPTLTTWGSYSTRAHVSQGTSGTIYLTAEGRWF